MDPLSQLKDKTGLVGGMCLTLLGQNVCWRCRSRGDETLEEEGAGGALCERPVSAKPAKLAEAVPRDSSNTAWSIFPALPEAARLCWLRSNLPSRLQGGQLLADSGLTLSLQPAWFSPTMPPPGSTNCTDTSLRAFIVCPGPF